MIVFNAVPEVLKANRTSDITPRVSAMFFFGVV
jgi:hypothetical protein